MAKSDYWRCTLTSSDGKRFEGLGWTEAEAKAQAKKLAKRRKLAAKPAAELTETTEKLRGPTPRTLKPRG